MEQKSTWQGVYKTEGIVLKAKEAGEFDLLLTLYTKGYGKILARAISARKKEGKLKGYLQTFSYGKFLLAKSRTIDIVTDVEPIDGFIYLRKSLDNLALAFYFSELVDKLVTGSEHDENLWRLLKRAFEVLNQKGTDLPKIKNLFEQKLLEFLGYGDWQAETKNKKSALDFIQGLINEEIKSKKFLVV